MNKKNNNFQHISDSASSVLVDVAKTIFPETVKTVQDALELIHSSAIGNGPPDASTITKGITRIATEAEVLAGIEPFAYVTPATLQAKWLRPEATTLVYGLTRYATDDELGFDKASDRVSTNTKGLWNVVRTLAVPSETKRGTVKLSSKVAAESGTDNTTAMTPVRVRESIAKFALTVVPGASESVAGLLMNVSNENASNAGLHEGYAISPKNFVQARATDGKVGTVRIATQAEANALADNSVALTPANIPRANGAQHGVVGITDTPQHGATTIALSAAGAMNLIGRSGGTAENLHITQKLIIGDWHISPDGGGNLMFRPADSYNGFYIDRSGNTSSLNNVSAYTSDRRVKHDITTIDSARHRLRGLCAYSYDQDNVEGRQVGVIAQEIEVNNPELVVQGDIKRVNYNGITALNTQALNEAFEMIDILRNEIEILKGKLK
ncbi:MAG: tail fiber domain-containing protein [Culicoidibacterales bacterium]